MWADTTTLFITLYKGDSEEGELLGKGKLRIEMDDFARQLTTMKAVNVPKGTSGIGALTAFGKFFAGNVWDTFVRGGLR